MSENKCPFCKREIDGYIIRYKHITTKIVARYYDCKNCEQTVKIETVRLDEK